VALGRADETSRGAIPRKNPQLQGELPRWDDLCVSVLWLALRSAGRRSNAEKNPIRFLNAILLKLGFYRRLPNGSGSLESARRFRTFLVPKLLNGGHGHEE
jgi:hypothetical protein